MSEVLYERNDAVVTLTLNRPDASNAMGPQTMKEILAAAERVRDESGVRAVVWTGAGKAFCAGGDLHAFAGAEDTRKLLLQMTDDLHAGLAILARIDAPVIAKVNGVAAGAGMSLVAACDLAVACESAKFTMAYTNAGLTPDGSSTYFLPRLIGMRRTKELMITNRLLSAAEALDWQLLTSVVPDGELDAAVDKLVARLASGPTGAFGTLKRLLMSSFDQTLEAQLADEGRGIAEQSVTPDGREGVAAFLAKRKPVFGGH